MPRKHIQVIHGPNLNMLGIREPEIYGRLTLDEINRDIQALALELCLEISFFQSNHEGLIIDKIQSCYGKMNGILINPGAFTHYSYAIRDAISSVAIPTVEVHLSNIMDREEFRRVSVLEDVCMAQIYGKGKDSYLEALKLLSDSFQNDHTSR